MKLKDLRVLMDAGLLDPDMHIRELPDRLDDVVYDKFLDLFHQAVSGVIELALDSNREGWEVKTGTLSENTFFLEYSEKRSKVSQPGLVFNSFKSCVTSAPPMENFLKMSDVFKYSFSEITQDPDRLVFILDFSNQFSME